MGLEVELEKRQYEFRVINQDRALLNMPPIICKIKKCMKCNKKFVSEGPQHRKCYSCRFYGKVENERAK